MDDALDALLKAPPPPGELRMKPVEEAQKRVKAAAADALKRKRTKKPKRR